jgi:hypothetical protein
MEIKNYVPIGRNLYEAELDGEKVLVKVYTKKEGPFIIKKGEYLKLVSSGRKVYFILVRGENKEIVTPEELEKREDVYFYDYRRTPSLSKSEKTTITITCDNETKKLFKQFVAKHMFRSYEEALVKLIHFYDSSLSVR